MGREGRTREGENETGKGEALVNERLSLTGEAAERKDAE